tara:strand:+ start:63 stop:344 length:282 start_codon:yes stop_codon:yes gene_type:complete
MTTTAAQTELNSLQIQVDKQLEARLTRICMAEWKAHTTGKNGKRKKNPRPMTYSYIVNDLLQLRQCLYTGMNPEDVSAAMQTGEINQAFTKAE